MDTELFSQIEETLDAAERCTDQALAQDYEQLDAQVRQLEATAREAFQEQLKDQYWTIAEKLEAGTPLSEKEHEALEFLIVGEAEYFLAEEEHFEDWRDTLRDLMQEVVEVRETGIDTIDDLMYLQAICLDASKVLPEITYYLRQKERIQRFKEGTREIDREAGKLLASTIREMMESDRM
jgi:hypothetical protein